MPRSIVHVLLALLLLLSQQTAQLHGLSHWDEACAAPGPQAQAQVLPDPDGGGMPEGLNDLCSGCAASAQLAFALPAAAYALAQVESASGAAAAPGGSGVCQRTICPFQPRGPPQA